MSLPQHIRPMSEAQARSIWAFVQEHQAYVGTIIVQCEAGMSRSPAVAAALCQALGIKPDRFHRDYQPNAYVHQTMLRACADNSNQRSQSGTVYVSDLLRRRHPKFYADLKSVLNRTGNGIKEVVGTRDIWIRDYAPVQVDENEYVQFTYQPSYLKGCQDTITPPQVMAQMLPKASACIYSDIVLDGGGVLKRGGLAIVTDRVFDENQHWSREELQSQLTHLLKVDRLIVIPCEPGDLFGHVDGVLQFIEPNRILMNEYSELDPAYGRRLTRILREAGIEMLPLAYAPTSRSVAGVPSAWGTYVNLLVFPSTLIVPTYGCRADSIVIESLGRMLPGHKIQTMEAKAVADEGGVLRCVTWWSHHEP
jgi:agmatine deiminase